MKSRRLKLWILTGLLLALISWLGFFLTPTGSLPTSPTNGSVKLPSPGSQFLEDLQDRKDLSPGTIIVVALLIGAVYFNLRRSGSERSERLSGPLVTKLGRDELSGGLFWLFAAIGLSAFTSSLLTHTTITEFYFFLVSTLSLQLTLLLGGSLLVFVHRPEIFNLSLDGPNFLRNTLYGVKLYLRVYPLILLTVILNRFIQNNLPVNQSIPPSLQFYESVTSRVEMVLLIGVIGLVAPIAEELFFRGIIYENLTTWVSPNHAALISGGIFALVHFQPTTVFPLWVLGIIFALVYEQTQSMTVVVIMHSLQNLLSLAIISSL